MEQFQKELVDYDESLLFQDDLKTWANAPRRSKVLRQHIVFGMNSDLLALGSTVTAQDRDGKKASSRERCPTKSCNNLSGITSRRSKPHTLHELTEPRVRAQTSGSRYYPGAI